MARDVIPPNPIPLRPFATVCYWVFKWWLFQGGRGSLNDSSRHPHVASHFFCSPVSQFEVDLRI